MRVWEPIKEEAPSQSCVVRTDDRRRDERRDCGFYAELTPADGAPIVVHVRDVSAGGVKFISREPLPIGAHLHFRPGISRPFPEQLEIRHCTDEGAGTFVVGAMFVGSRARNVA